MSAARKKPQRDPVLDRIREYRAACAEEHKAKAALAKLVDRLDAKEDYQAKVEKRTLSNKWPPLYLGHAYPVRSSKGARNHALIRLTDAGRAFGPKTARKLRALVPFATKEILGMLAAFEAEHGRKRTAAGLTALESARCAAAKVKARRRMVTTAPRTPQGAAALAEVLATFKYPDDDLELGLKALARAVREPVET